MEEYLRIASEEINRQWSNGINPAIYAGSAYKQRCFILVMYLRRLKHYFGFYKVNYYVKTDSNRE